MRLQACSLALPDPPEAWSALGFALDGGFALGDLRVELGAGPELRVAGLRSERPDGLPIVGCVTHGPDGGPDVTHPLGATALDHAVVVTDDLGRTVEALRAAGLDLRRTREAGPVRQAFFNLATTILEVGEVDPARAPAWIGPVEGARLWGLTVVVEDLDAAAARLGPLLGAPRDAVQPGRRIATVRREAGLALALALITPRVRTR